MELQPDEYTMSSAINACAKAGDATQAVEVLNKLEKQGLRPDGWSMRCTIQACSIAGEAKMAIEVMERMEGMDLIPDEKTMTTIINVCTKKNSAPKALRVLTKMEELGLEITHININTVLKALCRTAQSFEEQDAFLARMRSRSFVPDNYSYFEMLLACRRMPDGGARAPIVFDALLADGVDPHSTKLLKMLRECIGDEQCDAYCAAHAEKLQRPEPTRDSGRERGKGGRLTGYELRQSYADRRQPLEGQGQHRRDDRHWDERDRREMNGRWGGEQGGCHHEAGSEWDGRHREHSSKRSRSRSRERDGDGGLAEDGRWRMAEDWRLQEEDMRIKAARKRLPS